ncbi:MAG: hypothetical protein K2N14_03025 [Clostridia bacterium]|nr:hypothetical protein [Clostridia bacterium]
MKKTPNQEILNSDIMRYKTNKLPASLALLGIVFSCLYFCLLYGFKTPFFSMWKIGISVILTLVLLLVTFLASEGIKAYNKKYSIVLLVLAVVQIIRMFGLPLEALRYDSGLSAQDVHAFEIRYFGVDLSSGVSYTILIIWLAASAACLIAAAVIGYINCVKLENFQKKIANGEVNVEDVMAQMDEEDKAAAASNEAEKAVEPAVPVEQTENVSASEEEGE